MTSTWEIADEDISIIVSCHKSKTPVEVARAALDEIKIVDGLARYLDFADQVASASSEIEDQLMTAGLIPRGPKKFEAPAVAA